MRKFALIAALISFTLPVFASPFDDAMRNPQPSAAVQPARPAPTSLAPTSLTVAVTAPAAVDLNFAKLPELQTLNGIGPARAQAIIDNRPYGGPQDLVTKAGIPQTVLEGLRGRIAVVTVNINTAPAAELIDRLPGIGAIRAGDIVKGRPYKRPEDLVAKGVVTQGVFDNIKGIATTR